MRRLLAHPTIRYLCVGATCALANWGLMLAIDDKRYLLSSLISFVPVGTLGFLLHARWTFRRKPTVRSWLAYLGGLLANFPASLGTLALLRDIVGLPLWLAIPLVTIVMTIVNFFVARWAILLGARPAILGPRASRAGVP